MPTLYLIPYRKGERIGDDIYPLVLDGDTVRHNIHPEKLKEWIVEAHCGHTGMKCVQCQKYIYNNVKFANVLLYFVYDAETNILSHKTNYLPFTGLSYRYSDDEELIVVDGHFELALREGMFLSFNLPPTSKPIRFGCSMDFYVGTFEEEEEEEAAAINADVDIDDEEEDDDDGMVEDDEEEDNNNNQSVVLLSDNDDDDDDDEPPQLIVHNAESIETSFENNNNMEDDDDDGPPPLVSLYGDNEVVYFASDRGPVAVQPPLDPRPPPQVPEDARVQFIGTPHRVPDPPGSTPLNFSSPIPTNALNKNASPPLSEDGDTDDIAVVLRIQLEETQAQLHASLARNALLSPFAKGYQPLNSP